MYSHASVGEPRYRLFPFTDPRSQKPSELPKRRSFLPLLIQPPDTSISYIDTTKYNDTTIPPLRSPIDTFHPLVAVPLPLTLSHLGATF